MTYRGIAEVLVICAYCKNGDHEMSLPRDVECSCVCHGENFLATAKTVLGLLACLAFIALFWWAAGRLL